MAKKPEQRARTPRRLSLVSFSVVVFLVLLFAVEGCSSVLLALRTYRDTRPLARQKHTRHDAELGWVHIPNVHVRDLYGPGKDLRTNAQGFRGLEDVAPAPSPGRVRIVCSGDSFTLGYGVGDEHTWPYLLAGLDPRLETVNMGQGAYGVDQIYLWYLRDGADLGHRVHLFAFVHDDFRRMTSSDFLGYEKPYLALEGGALEVRNVPVPERRFYWWWHVRVRPALGEMRIVRLFGGEGARPGPVGDALAESDVAAVTLQVFRDLDRVDRSKGSVFVPVFLPMRADYRPLAADRWRLSLARQVRAEGMPFIDLVERLRALPRDQVERMFIRQDALKYRGAAGHYTEEGNARIAAMILEEMRAIPAVRVRLGPVAGPGPVGSGGP